VNQSEIFWYITWTCRAAEPKSTSFPKERIDLVYLLTIFSFLILKSQLGQLVGITYIQKATPTMTVLLDICALSCDVNRLKQQQTRVW